MNDHQRAFQAEVTRLVNVFSNCISEGDFAGAAMAQRAIAEKGFYEDRKIAAGHFGAEAQDWVMHHDKMWDQGKRGEALTARANALAALANACRADPDNPYYPRRINDVTAQMDEKERT